MAVKALTVTCRSHCRACGRHFGGDRAFEAHRVFLDEDGTPLSPQPRKADWSTRGCAHPEDVGLKAVEGECRISFDQNGPGTIWRQREPGWKPPQARAGSA